MTRLQALLIAVSVAFAVVSGTYAAMQTTRLGTGATTHVSATSIAHQRRTLDRTAVALHKALRQRPPKLPAFHKPAPPAPRYVYVPASRTPSAAASSTVIPVPVRRSSPLAAAANAPSAAGVRSTIRPKPSSPRDIPQGAAGGAAPATTTTTTTAPPPVVTTAPATPPATTSSSSPAPSGGGSGGGSDNGSDDGGSDNGGGADD